MQNYLGSEIKKLGFGFMRLPMNGEQIDMEQTKEMVDLYMSKGFTYFDTAYVYINGTSEVGLKEALVDRYPRESYQVASKLPPWNIKKEGDMEELFNTTIERMGVDYIDFYLLHCLNRTTNKTMEDFGAWEYVAKLKKEGKIKHMGFSFHDKADYLDELLTAHPETEFVQLQINYLDWESNGVQSRLCYEVAQKHGVPVIIMEPVKGGTLASLAPDAAKVFKDYAPEKSIPSWAIRYAASLDNVITVLSGMSNMEQMEDNLSYMENFEKLSSEEQGCVDKVVEILNNVPQIPCTSCKYCVEGCPQNINIPGLFGAVNHHKKFDADDSVAGNMGKYEELTKDNGKASDCLSCGACMEHCPQNINIIEELEKIAKIYEK